MLEWIQNSAVILNFRFHYDWIFVLIIYEIFVILACFMILCLFGFIVFLIVDLSILRNYSFTTKYSSSFSYITAVSLSLINMLSLALLFAYLFYCSLEALPLKFYFGMKIKIFLLYLYVKGILNIVAG